MTHSRPIQRRPARRLSAWSSGVALALSLCACGEGQSAAPATAGTTVSVVGAAGSGTSPAPTATPTPVATPTPAATATATPSPTPTPTASATPAAAGKPVLLSEGDSQSVFWGGNHTGIYAASRPGVTFLGKAVGGSRISDVGGGNGLVQRVAADLALHPDYVTILIGANDMGDGSYQSAEGWLSALWSYVATIRASGAKVAVGTVLPLCMPQFPEYNNTHKARRPTVNAAIRAAVGSRIDAVIDFAADPDIGPDAAACDKNWYYDGLHPTDGGPTYTGGQGRMAKVYTDAMDRWIK